MYSGQSKNGVSREEQLPAYSTRVDNLKTSSHLHGFFRELR